MDRSVNPLPSTYYQATAHLSPARPMLRGEVTADVCVIGGGVAGCSTALHLAQRGYRVVLLEAEQVGQGASGRSGGQLLPGYSCGQQPLVAQLGHDLARSMWSLSVEAVQLTRELIAQHAIDCELAMGHLEVAIKPKQRAELIQSQREFVEQYDYHSLRLIERDELRTLIDSQRYCAALYDSAAAQVHPLNYTLGLARAAEAAGVVVYEHAAVQSITPGKKIEVHGAQGKVKARFAVLCTNAYNGRLSSLLKSRIMPVSTYMIATESLGAARANKLISNRAAVSDTNFILDYFRLSVDHRLLFGGRISYSNYEFRDNSAALRNRMLRVFPQLADVKVAYTWGGLLDITLNRAPDFGRLQNNIYYLQGFSGHGMALAGMAGKLVAENIATQSERFDLYERIKHRKFPGGAWLRMPALVLAMLWYRLRDLS
jgi:gamma-glutamylputrescine oxidase